VTAPPILRRPLAAGLLLLAVYIGLSFVNDTRGYLGSDTGGKVATLQVMKERRRLDPDIGYWAERWDPTGRFHPLYSTTHAGRRWINVTSLPAIVAAYPLFILGGYRLALFVPMLGAVMSAFAARALAGRLGASDRTAWTAFWLTGLASPIAIYALDVWEHSLGVALMGWAVVCLVDVARAGVGFKGAVVKAAAAGALFGLAATMRQEAYVYAFVATAAALLWVLLRERHRGVGSVVSSGAAAVIGLLVIFGANAALEHKVAGTSLRVARARGVVGAVGSGSAAGGTSDSRVGDAVVTAVSLNPDQNGRSYLVGLASLGLLVLAVARGRSADGRRPAALALAAAGVLYVVRAVDGPGFVPGAVAASPLAVVGLVVGWRSSAARRYVVATALLALPVVWITAYTGAAGAQWGGRYVLVSGFLLAVAGTVAFDRLTPSVRRAFVVLSLAVTMFGLSWLAVRSHDTGQAFAAIRSRPEPVLIWRDTFVPREGGWFYPGSRWLAARTHDDEDAAARVAVAAGFERIAVVRAVTPRVDQIRGWQVTGRSRIRWFTGVPVYVTSYRYVPRATGLG
jgi:hypothetical protein